MAELADAPDLGSGGTPVQVQVLSPVPYAEVVKLADALDSKSSDSNIMRVQVPPSAPQRRDKPFGSSFYKNDFTLSAIVPSPPKAQLSGDPNLIHPYQEWWRERPCETRQPDSMLKVLNPALRQR